MSLSLVVLTIQAQRIGCVHSEERSATRSDSYALPMPIDFDPQKTYRQPVVLITFSDQDFSMDNPKEYYDRLFNEKGFNKGYGVGCVADYFRDQSGGRLNMQFDIYGPFKLNKSAGGHGSDHGTRLGDRRTECHPAVCLPVDAHSSHGPPDTPRCASARPPCL